MSVDHQIYLYTNITHFSDKNVKRIKEYAESNTFTPKKINIDKEHIFIEIQNQRPNIFYVTTKKKDAILPILDVALFSTVKYEQNQGNVFFCEMALLIKYLLKENVCLRSDGFNENWIDGDWKEAERNIQNAGYDIRIQAQKDRTNFWINGKKVENVFDENGEIFKKMVISWENTEDN